ncbi:MAG TPA: tetratricopeptide repeat protein [Flavobacterium sp.]|uniref:tetratricopeptide repeat-containing sensor histidine kinase n=2 Tax=Flavobacterium TaxID=237 RepID=UPI0025BB4B98|nr:MULTISPECIES: tetratricopeptide repeat protein [unclassified Flavobacterium]HRE79141.1 tetratricopeptide repeat protein [Flavobacterium sp.]
MTKKLKAVIFFGLFFMQIFAQVKEHKVIDSLNVKALKIYASNTNKAMELLSKAEKIAKAEKLNLSLAYTLDNMGIVTRVKGNYEKAIDYSEKALTLTKDSLIVASAYNNIGSCKRNLGLYEESLKAYLKSIKIYDKKKDLNNQAIINNNIGLVYRSLEMNEKAKSYHQKAIVDFEKLKKKKGLSEAYNNMAIVYAYEDSLANALRYFKYSLKIEEELKDFRGIAESLNNVGGVYYYMEKIDSALIYFKQAIKLEHSIKNYAGLASSYNNIGDVYLYKENYLEAKKNFDSAFVYAKKSKSAFDIENTYNYYALLYEAKNDYKKANEYHNLKNQFRDSIQKLSNIKQLQELETKYQTAKKDTEIAQNRAELAENELKIKQKNTIIFGSLGFAFVLGLLGYLLYNQQKIKNNQLIKEVELKEALVKIETQNKLQEQRLQISRDLHDNIGSQLTFIISSIDNLKYFDIAKEKLVSKFDNISGFTKNTITELRDTIWAMNKNAISVEDLQIRITNFIDNAQLATHGISFDFSIEDSVNASHEFSSIEGMNIYRIIQEAVNNAIKYANASQIKILLKQENNKMIFSINDNGIGFSESEIELGNGLNNMKKRALELNADLKIISEKDKGTSILIEKQIS